jgi:hypothetical protein
MKGGLSMCWVRKNRLALKFLAIGLSVAFGIPGFASELKSARAYPTGKITIYREGHKVGEYNKEAPFPEGFLIASDGRCGVKMDDLYLVAEDKSLFSVETEVTQRKLFIRKGVVYFAMSKKTRLLSFVTPVGTVNALEITLNAAAGNPLLKGYVSVNKGCSEIGIVEGGAMLVSTRQGEKLIKSGQKLILAQVEMDIGPKEEKEVIEEKEEEEKKPGMSKNQKIGLVAIGSFAAAAVIAGLASGDGGGGNGGVSPSPSSP